MYKNLILLIIFCIIILLVQNYKLSRDSKNDKLEKIKGLIQNTVNNIPDKMKKIIVKTGDTFPAGMIKLASIVGKRNDKIIEAFEDIKDIRYGKIGASNHNGGVTINKWIKIANFTISGAWDTRGFTLEVYPRIRYHTSGRQTLVTLVRNAVNDIETPYVSLTTHNESEPTTRLIQNVKIVRRAGSGVSNNKIEVWIQFGQQWADTAYVMYYLYNFKTDDFIAVLPQPQSDNPPAGQNWGINDKIEPQDGKRTITGAKGQDWGTAINVNAPQKPESLYSLHFGDGSAIHERQTGMGYIKDQPNRIWGNTHGTLGMHIHQDDDFHLYSSGWNPLFSIKGGSGNAYIKGNLSAMGGANLEGTVRFRHAGANGNDDSDPYYLEKIRAGSDNNSLRMTINDNADESFQIWGDSCGAGNCAGPGALKHHFQATGRTQHLTNDGDAHSEQLIIGTTDRSNLRLGKTADYSWIQSHGGKPLRINPLGNDVYFNKIKLGDKFTMSGVGDRHGNDGWLRLFGTDESGYWGGLAAGSLWTQAFYNASDEKMKENITKLDRKDMLRKLSKLNGYIYNLKKDEKKKKKYGVIAQKVAEEFPEMVETGANGLLSIEYNQLISVLIEAVNELNEKCSNK